MGHAALGLDQATAIAAQNKAAQFIVDAMNEKMARDYPAMVPKS